MAEGISDREEIINNYVAAYNQFNIDKMVSDFDDEIVFENVQNDQTNMSLKGLAAFRTQAEQAKTFFSERRQTITSFTHYENVTEIEINYYAILDQDFPNGLKKGQVLELSGKSIFVFEKRKIIKLTDIS